MIDLFIFKSIYNHIQLMMIDLFYLIINTLNKFIFINIDTLLNIYYFVFAQGQNY